MEIILKYILYLYSKYGLFPNIVIRNAIKYL